MGVMRPANIRLGTLFASGWCRVALIALFALPLLFIADAAFAAAAPSGITGYANQVDNRIDDMPATVNYIAFVLGAILVALGLSEMRKYVEGSGQIALKQPLIKLGFGGAFLAFPFIAGVMFDTMLLEADFFDLKKSNVFLFKSMAVNAQGLSGLIANSINQAMVFINIAAFAGFFIATFLTMRGIQMLRAHMENPGQNPLPEAIKRLGVGGLLFALPVAVNVVVKTFGATADAMRNTGYNVTDGSGGGLDGMLVNFVKDISNPAFFGIELFCYIAGILMILFALQRLVRTAQDGPRGPLGFGTIVMFIVAALLLSFPQFISTIDSSIIGGTGGKALTQVKFMSTIESAGNTQQAKNVFGAVLAFMAVIGFLSVVRGLFLLKSFADGNQQASMMSVVTHIVAGSLAINLGTFINAVQTSLGVTDFPVTFY